VELEELAVHHDSTAARMDLDAALSTLPADMRLCVVLARSAPDAGARLSCALACVWRHSQRLYRITVADRGRRARAGGEGQVGALNRVECPD
jgi:hypothetical protein